MPPILVILKNELRYNKRLCAGGPTITVEPVEAMVDAGSTVLLHCRAEGEPAPVIEWARQGRPLLASDRLSTLANGSLRLSSTQLEDTAQYECVARNLLGSVRARVALTVRGESQREMALALKR